jgi:hypothetical protein
MTIIKKMLALLNVKYHKHLINFHKVLKLKDVQEIFGSDGTFRSVIPLIELCIEPLDRNMIMKDNSEIMVTSFTESIQSFMNQTKNEIIESNIHQMNALTTSIDFVNKFRNDFVVALNVALE